MSELNVKLGQLDGNSFATRPSNFVIASVAKQSRVEQSCTGLLRRLWLLAMTGSGGKLPHYSEASSGISEMAGAG